MEAKRRHLLIEGVGGTRERETDLAEVTRCRFKPFGVGLSAAGKRRRREFVISFLKLIAVWAFAPSFAAAESEIAASVIIVGIASDGAITWNGEAVPDDNQFESILEDTARLQPQPQIRVQPRETSKYEDVAKVVSILRKYGLTSIGFFGDPRDYQ